MTAVNTAMPVVSPASADSAASAPPATDTSAPKHHFSFDDILDIVNPLQHLPIVSTIYRKLTHDQIGTPEKIMGDTLFGGIPGLISSVADTAFEKITGKNFADTALSLFDSGDSQPKFASDEIAPTQMALANTTPTLDFDDAGETTTAKPMSEQEITASLNRNQIRLAQLDRAATAYASANTLSSPKPTDVASAAY